MNKAKKRAIEIVNAHNIHGPGRDTLVSILAGYITTARLFYGQCRKTRGKIFEIRKRFKSLPRGRDARLFRAGVLSTLDDPGDILQKKQDVKNPSMGRLAMQEKFIDAVTELVSAADACQWHLGLNQPWMTGDEWLRLVNARDRVRGILTKNDSKTCSGCGEGFVSEDLDDTHCSNCL